MTLMQAQAARQAATRYGSPYAAIEAYSKGELAEPDLVELLGAWPYAPIPDGRDPAGVESEPRGLVPGSAQEILKALNRRLIDRRLYSLIRKSIHEQQGE